MDEKTRWAEDRTVLAAERTFAAWARTGTSAVAVAIGLRVIFDGADPVWLPKIVAMLFILVALYVFNIARHQAVTTQERLSGHSIDADRTRHYTLSAISLSVGAVVTGGFLIFH